MTKKEVLELIKQVMPSPDYIYDTPEEMVTEIWRNIDYIEHSSERKE